MIRNLRRRIGAIGAQLVLGFMSATALAQAEVPPIAEAFDLLVQTPVAEGGLTAQEVAKRAVLVSSRVASAGATVGNAQRRADRAYSLFVPRLDLSAGYRRLSEVDVDPAVAMFFPQLLNQYSARARVTVPLSDYFVMLGEYYDSAQQLEVVARHQLEAERLRIAHEARRDYYQLARALVAHRLALHRVGQLEHFVEEIRALVDGGEISPVNLSHAQVRLAGARAQAHNDLANLHVAQETLRRRLGFLKGEPVGIAEPLTTSAPAPPSDLRALIDEAYAARPEVKALRSLTAAHTHTGDAIAASRYPQLALVGDVNLDNPNQRVQPVSDEFKGTWSVGVELHWSPSDLAARNNELDDVRLEASRAQWDLRTLERRIALEVTQAYESAVAAASVAEMLQSSVTAAQDTLQVATALFHAGEGTSREVLDAEIDLRQAQLQWADGSLARHSAQAALDAAVGR